LDLLSGNIRRRNKYLAVSADKDETRFGQSNLLPSEESNLQKS